MASCCKNTKKGHPCPHHADRCRDGVWYCHVHDPGGVFRENVLAGRRDKAAVVVDRNEARKQEREEAWARALKRMIGD